jgi:hypothetical protein
MDRSTIDQFIWNGNGMNVDGNKMYNGMEWNRNGMERKWNGY